MSVAAYSHESSGDYRIFLRAILAMACRKTGDTARVVTETEALRQFVQIHGTEFNNPGAPVAGIFLTTLDRAFTMILAREALAAE